MWKSETPISRMTLLRTDEKHEGRTFVGHLPRSLQILPMEIWGNDCARHRGRRMPSLADSVAPKAVYPSFFFLGRGNKEVGPLLKKTESRQYRAGPADCLRKQWTVFGILSRTLDGLHFSSWMKTWMPRESSREPCPPSDEHKHKYLESRRACNTVPSNPTLRNHRLRFVVRFFEPFRSNDSRSDRQFCMLDARM